MRRRTSRRAMTGMIKSSGLLCGGGGEGWTETASSILPPLMAPKEEAEVASLARFFSNPAQSITEPRGDRELFCIASYLGRLRVKTDPPFNTIPAITYSYGFSARPQSNKRVPSSATEWSQITVERNLLYFGLGGRKTQNGQNFLSLCIIGFLYRGIKFIT